MQLFEESFSNITTSLSFKESLNNCLKNSQSILGKINDEIRLIVPNVEEIEANDIKILEKQETV